MLCYSKSMPKTVIDIIGFAGSGKSSVCEYLVAHYGFSLYRPSDALRAYAKQHGRILSGREDYIKCHEEMIANDPNAIIRPVFESNSQLICLDGMRAPAPFQKLRRELDAKLIYLHCDIEERFKRTQNDTARTGHRALPDLETFRSDEAPDYDNPNQQLPNMNAMITLADYTIDASQPYDQVLRQIDAIATKLTADI